MYAVIRAGGKQYRVAPGDVIRVEKEASTASNGHIEFTDILAVSGEEGKIGRPQGDGARVTGRIIEQGRADKILVFHFKRKKQYKKLAGHRQPFTAVKITEIAFDGHSFKAAEEAAPVKKAKHVPAAEAEGHEREAAAKHAAGHKAGKAKTGAKHKTSAKSTSKKKK